MTWSLGRPSSLMLVFKKGKIKQTSKGMYNGRLFAVSMQVFLQKAPRSGEQTAAEETTEARAPRAWGRLRARCPPLPHLGDTPLRSVVPASVGAKSMDGY